MLTRARSFRTSASTTERGEWVRPWRRGSYWLRNERIENSTFLAELVEVVRQALLQESDQRLPTPLPNFSPRPRLSYASIVPPALSVIPPKEYARFLRQI